MTHGAAKPSPLDRLVKFDLPFPLLLDDSLKLPEDERNEEQFAEPIYVAGTPAASVRAALRSNRRGDFASRGVLEGGDPYGRITYTRLQVRFNVTASPEILDWSDDELIDEALRVANRVVEVYRDVAHRPVLRQVVRPHIVHFLVIDAFEDEEMQTRAVARARGPLRVGLGEEELAIQHALRARLQTEEPVEFVRELYLDMRSRMETEDYRLAAIEASVLFEAWLKDFLAGHLRRQGSSEDEVRDRFLNADGSPRSVTNLALKAVKDITGFDFARTSECRRWEHDARDLRNEVVHGQRRLVTREEANRAIAVVTEANQTLRSAAPLS